MFPVYNVRNSRLTLVERQPFKLLADLDLCTGFF
jgi:hypothetical protein